MPDRLTDNRRRNNASDPHTIEAAEGSNSFEATTDLSECDDRQLLLILQTDGATADRERLLDHIETCSQCQIRLQELAASNEDWRLAEQILPSPNGEVPGAPSTGSSAVPSFDRWLEAGTVWNESLIRKLLDPPSHPEMLGRLGRYEIERLVGSGGMGIVCKAYDSELNRTVAIKILAPYLAGSGSARHRFSREARSAAGVVDDHVVPIYNVESEHQHPFLVMQYVAGGSLQETLDRTGPLDIVGVLRIGMQAAKGLAAAHAQGLIHRDVKPSNILLDEGVERAVLTDFGLARAEDDACLTRSGFHPGTPQYMSPEQVRGENVDQRSDLFSLGCVLYAMCTGRAPFRAETTFGVLRRITDDSPQLVRELNPEVPDWLCAIIDRLLAKKADERFHSAEEVARMLGACLAHVQQPTVMALPNDLPIKQTSAKKATTPGSRWTSPALLQRSVTHLIAALVVSAILLSAAILLIVEINKGELVLRTNMTDVPVRILKDDKVVDELVVGTDETSVRVPAGTYVVEIDGAPEDLVVRGRTVTLERRGKEIVTIVRESKAPNKGGTSTSDLHLIRDNSSPDSPKTPSLADSIKALKLYETRARESETPDRKEHHPGGTPSYSQLAGAYGRLYEANQEHELAAELRLGQARCLLKTGKPDDHTTARELLQDALVRLTDAPSIVRAEIRDTLICALDAVGFRPRVIADTLDVEACLAVANREFESHYPNASITYDRSNLVQVRADDDGSVLVWLRRDSPDDPVVAAAILRVSKDEPPQIERRIFSPNGKDVDEWVIRNNCHKRRC